MVKVTKILCDRCHCDITDTKIIDSYEGELCSMCVAIKHKEDNENKLLTRLGLTYYDFGRLRSILIEDDRIHACARIGGRNNEEYKRCFKILRHNQYYDDDDSDFYDSTYHKETILVY